METMFNAFSVEANSEYYAGFNDALEVCAHRLRKQGFEVRHGDDE